MAREYVYTRPWMYPKQTQAFFNDSRMAVTEATTKAGKTIGCMAWLNEMAFLGGKPGRHYWWTAPTYKVASIAFERLYRGLVDEAGKKILIPNKSDLSLTIPYNEAVLDFKSAENPDNLYGQDVFGAVMDEFTRCPEAAFFALRSTLTATKGKLRLIGNVNGRKNWGYRLARLAEQAMADGNPDYHYAKITAYDAAEAGVIDAKEIEDARFVLPDHVWRELYLAEPSDDGGNPFGLAAIASCINPLSSSAPVAWGVDLAKSHDWTVAIALDAQARVCRYARWQAPWETTIGRLTELIGNDYALVDSTGVGDPIVEQMHKHCRHITGFTFTSHSKQQIMEGLAAAVQTKTIGFPDEADLPGCVIRDEMDTFEFEYSRTGVKYAAPEGLHDDAVCSLALAREQWRHRQGGFVDTDLPEEEDEDMELVI